MVAVLAAAEREGQPHRAFSVYVTPCGHVQMKATGAQVDVNDIESQAGDVEAQIVIALSTYRYISEIAGSRRVKVRRLHLDGSVGPVLWRYTPLPGEEPRIWQVRVRDRRALREQLQVELTMVAAGCPLMLDQVDLELVAVDESWCRVRF